MGSVSSESETVGYTAEAAAAAVLSPFTESMSGDSATADRHPLQPFYFQI